MMEDSPTDRIFAPLPLPGSSPQHRISLFFGDDGATWADYLSEQLQACHLAPAVEKYDIHQLKLLPLSPHTCSMLTQSHLQVLVLSPQLLDELENDTRELQALLQPERVLAFLVGVTCNQLSAVQTMYPAVNSWKRLAAEDKDIDCIRTFICLAREIVQQTGYRTSEAVSPASPDSGTAVAPPAFTVAAGAPKNGYISMFLLLRDALQNAEEINVRLYHAEEDGFEIHPNIQMLNAFTVCFCILEYICRTESLLVEVTREEASLGAQRTVVPRDMVWEYGDALSLPVMFICQALRHPLSSTERNLLDEVLTERLATCPHSPQSDGGLHPTVLHLAAALGLRKLCCHLMNSDPEAQRALRVVNTRRQTPAQMALAAGHWELAQTLQPAEVQEELGNSEIMPMVEEWSAMNDEELCNSIHEYLSRHRRKSGEHVEASIDSGLVAETACPDTQTSGDEPHYAVVGGDINYLETIRAACADEILSSGPYLTMMKEGEPTALPPRPALRQPPATSVRCLEPESSVAVPSFISPSVLSPTQPASHSGSSVRSSTDTSRSSRASAGAAGHDQSLSSTSSSHELRHILTAADNDCSSWSVERRDGIHTLSPDAYKPASRQALPTQEEELIEILTDFKNSKYTLSEVNAIAEAWMMRDRQEQARRHQQHQLKQRMPDVHGLFGRIANIFTSKRTDTSVLCPAPSPLLECGKVGDDRNKLKRTSNAASSAQQSFVSYMSDFDKTVQLMEGGARRLAGYPAVTTAGSSPGRPTTVPTDLPPQPEPHASLPSPGSDQLLSEDLYVTMQNLTFPQPLGPSTESAQLDLLPDTMVLRPETQDRSTESDMASAGLVRMAAPPPVVRRASPQVLLTSDVAHPASPGPAIRNQSRGAPVAARHQSGGVVSQEQSKYRHNSAGCAPQQSGESIAFDQASALSPLVAPRQLIFSRNSKPPPVPPRTQKKS